MKSFGYVHRMAKGRVVSMLYEWKPIFARLAGRPKIRWENDIKEDLRIMKINNWTKCIQDRVKWKDLRRTELSNSEGVAPEEERRRRGTGRRRRGEE